MARFAATLSGSRLNPLVLMSDPDRTPNLLELAAQMPPRSALIYRHFGKPGLERRLRALTEARGVQFLIGNDPELALACGADGVHFPRTASAEVLQHWRQSQPKWIISAAAAKNHRDKRPVALLDALFVSPVFASDSLSAGTAVGVDALMQATVQYGCPVFALGGITGGNAPTLKGSGITGIASISGLATELRTQIVKPVDESNPQSPVSISKEQSETMIIFTATVTGETATGELTLRHVSGGVWNANHTGVPKNIGGRGVGKALVQAMVQDARQHGYRVVPTCPFVAKLFERNPKWAKDVEV